MAVEKEMHELVDEIQNKTPPLVRAIIIDNYGPANRDVGSGISIEQWYVNGGVLTYHPVTGVYFQKNGDLRALIKTTNYVKDNILGNYEMSSLPDKYNYGTRYWLGNLELSEKSYLFERSRPSHEISNFGVKNYFFRNPNGQVDIEYANNSIEDIALENIDDGAIVAKITFTAENSSEAIKYNIINNKLSKSLSFSGVSLIDFKIDKGWEYYWQNNKTNKANSADAPSARAAD